MNILDTGLIGLDFGSSKTVISLLKKGVLEIVLNECSLRETHNIVGFTEKETLIGDQAFMKLKSNYKNTILFPLRYINPAILEEELFFNIEAKWQSAVLNLEKTKNNSKTLSFSVSFLGEKREFQPVQILALLLGFYSKKIFINSQFFYSNYGFVMSVPAYFTQEERVLLSKAAHICSLNLLKILNESAAIGILYKKIHDEELLNFKKVLFVDVGYSKTGLFSISFEGGNVSLIQENYDRHLGVRDIDNLMLEFYQGIIKKQKPNYQENFKMRLKLLEAIERQRKVLSANNEAPIIVESLYDDYDLNYVLKRTDFEILISPFLEKLRNLLIRFKVETELSGKNIDFDEIEIIGGGVRIPIIQKVILEVFPINSLSKTLNGTECFAMGSALYCNKLAGIQTNPVITNLNEMIYYSIYCATKPKGLYEIIVFNKGINFPCNATVKIPKEDEIKSIVFYYKLGEKIFPLYELNIEEEKKDAIIIQCSINDDGVFIVKDLKINENRCKIKYEKDLMNLIEEEELQKFICEYDKIEKHDRLIQESYEMKNMMESYIYSKRGELLEKYRLYLPEKTQEEIAKIFEEYEHWIYNHDDSQSAKGYYEAKFKELKDKIQPLYENCHELHETGLLKQQEITTLLQLKDFIEQQKQPFVDCLNINLCNQRIGNGGGLLSYFKDGMNRLKEYINKIKIQETLRLDLRNNALTDKAFEYLIEIIEFQKDLVCLEIFVDNSEKIVDGKNEFSDKIVFKFIECLKNLNRLKRFKFAIDNMDDLNFKLFTITIENMKGLEKVEVRLAKGKVTKEAKNLFSTIKALNKTVKICKLECGEMGN